MTDHQRDDPIGPLGLERGLDILEILAEETAGLRFTDLHRRLGIAKPVLSRLLKALQARGYVCKDPSERRYVRGSALLHLTRGMEWLPHSRKALATAAQPYLDELVACYEQSAMVLHWDGRQLESVATATADEGLAPWPVGTRRDQFQRGPWGAVVLTELGEDPRARVASDDKSLPYAVLCNAMARLREHGWLLLEKRHCLRYAVPLRGPEQRLVGILGLLVNPLMLDQQRRWEVVESVLQVGRTLSRLLGGELQVINKEPVAAMALDHEEKAQ